MKKTQERTFGYLLYLYFWPFWMFKDVNKQNVFERAAAWSHNKSKIIYLPLYMFKWGIISLVLFFILFLLDKNANNIICFVSGLMGLLLSISIIVNIKILIIYIFIKKWNHY